MFSDSKTNIQRWLIISYLPILLVLSGCTVKPQATGNDNELGILIDADLRVKLESALLTAFCPILETPQPERRFIPIFAGYEGLDRLQTQKYLLLVGILNGRGEVSRLITKMLSPEVRQGVENGEYFIFTKRNEWAREQKMMILVAPSESALAERLASESELFFEAFNKERSEYVKKKLYRSYEQKDLSREIRERYGFDLRIPHDYVLVREEPEEGWLRLKRSAPDRLITLWRSEVLQENPLDSAWVFDTWSNLALQFADPVQANREYLSVRESEVAGYPGLEMRGLWETKGSLGGGPFLCRAFFYPAEKRVYLLEGEVYNPGDVKEPYVKQLEVILETFKPANSSQIY